jgi:hypothetical protein
MARLTAAGKTTLVALVVATVAFCLLEAAGLTDTPLIPPALVGIIAAALVVAFLPGRASLQFAAAVGLVSVALMFVFGGDDRLTDPKSTLDLIGGWILIGSLAVAVVAGLVGSLRWSGE